MKEPASQGPRGMDKTELREYLVGIVDAWASPDEGEREDVALCVRDILYVVGVNEGFRTVQPVPAEDLPWESQRNEDGVVLTAQPYGTKVMLLSLGATVYRSKLPFVDVAGADRAACAAELLRDDPDHHVVRR